MFFNFYFFNNTAPTFPRRSTRRSTITLVTLGMSLFDIPVIGTHTSLGQSSSKTGAHKNIDNIDDHEYQIDGREPSTSITLIGSSHQVHLFLRISVCILGKLYRPEEIGHR